MCIRDRPGSGAAGRGHRSGASYRPFLRPGLAALYVSLMDAPLPWWSPADFLTAVRIPLAVAFVAIPDNGARLVILAAAGGSDFADGLVARKWGGSRLGAFLDPVADKLFMARAFAVVLVSGALNVFE